MNLVQSVQSVRSLTQFVGSVAQKRPVSQIVGDAAGVLFSVQTGGAGSLGADVVASAVTTVVDGAESVVHGVGSGLRSAVQTGAHAIESVANGVYEAAQEASRLGRVASTYATEGARSLGRLVDHLV